MVNECKACWWQEGGRCYHGDPVRDENGKSNVIANGWCKNWESKRRVMKRAVPAAAILALKKFIPIDQFIAAHETEKGA